MLLLHFLYVRTSLKNVTISNVLPRLDTRGNIVNAHDGTIRFIEGFWWLHAASYGAGSAFPSGRLTRSLPR